MLPDNEIWFKLAQRSRTPTPSRAVTLPRGSPLGALGVSVTHFYGCVFSRFRFSCSLVSIWVACSCFFECCLRSSSAACGNPLILAPLLACNPRGSLGLLGHRIIVLPSPHSVLPHSGIAFAVRQQPPASLRHGTAWLSKQWLCHGNWRTRAQGVPLGGQATAAGSMGKH